MRTDFKDEAMERWMPIQELPGYSVSDRGRIMKDETGQKIRTQKEQAEEEARQMSENSLKEAEASAQKEADALRQLVEPKREEALEAVITSLV